MIKTMYLNAQFPYTALRPILTELRCRVRDYGVRSMQLAVHRRKKGLYATICNADLGSALSITHSPHHIVIGYYDASVKLGAVFDDLCHILERAKQLPIEEPPERPQWHGGFIARIPNVRSA